jgi:hypothetical protein
VTVGKDKKPAANETVTLVEVGTENPAGGAGRGQADGLVRWATTDKDGKYSIRVGAGGFQIWVQAGEHSPQELTVGTEKTLTRNFHINREPRVWLTGVVQTADGKPVAEALVQGGIAGPPYRSDLRVVADAKGRFRTERWRHKMRLYTRNPDGDLATLVELGEDDKEAKLVLAPAGKMHGRLTDAIGKPLPNRTVFCQIGRDAWSLQVETDPEGRFRLAGVVPGPCRLSASDTETTAELKTVEVKAGQDLALGDLTFKRKP